MASTVKRLLSDKVSHEHIAVTPMKTYQIIVKGRVQGVGYRAFAQKYALEMGITGNVKNTSSGCVYIEATADEQTLHRFLEKCKKGPVWASVDDVESNEIPLEKFTSFRITH